MTSLPKKKKRSKTSTGGNYKRGSAHERFLRDDLYCNKGALLVMRGAGSKSVIPKSIVEQKWLGNGPKVDLIALFPNWPTSVLLVQSKPRAGSIPKKQRLALVSLASKIHSCVAEGYRKKGANYDIIYCTHIEEGARNCTFLQ